ncbi:MAG: DUF4873 domain-containing protein [Nocardioidaceae bacterium]
MTTEPPDGQASGQPDEGYDGPATLLTDNAPVEVTVRLRGVFQPIDGRYHWYGRINHDPRLDAATSGGTVTLRTPQGEATGTLSDVDPWGRPRVSGVGRPPFVVDDLAEVSPHEQESPVRA